MPDTPTTPETPTNITPKPAVKSPLAGVTGSKSLGWIAIILLMTCLVLVFGILKVVNDKASASEEIGKWKGRAETERERADAAEQREVSLLQREDSIRRSYVKQIAQMNKADSIKAAQDDSAAIYLSQTGKDSTKNYLPQGFVSSVPIPTLVPADDSTWRRRFSEYQKAATDAVNACKRVLGDCEKGWAAADSARKAADEAKEALKRQNEANAKALAAAERSRKIRLIQGITIGAAACTAINRGMK